MDGLEVSRDGKSGERRLAGGVVGLEALCRYIMIDWIVIWNACIVE
jgi:hypothetical protein